MMTAEETRRRREIVQSSMPHLIGNRKLCETLVDIIGSEGGLVGVTREQAVQAFVQHDSPLTGMRSSNK